MTPVGYLSDFPKDKSRIYYVKQFFGKTHADAVENANKEGVFDFYYAQIHCGKMKSILVCWDGGKRDEE